MSTHDLAHFAIFGGYLVAMYLVPASLSKLVRISWYTVVFGSGFFLLCGLTHVGIALDQSDATWVSVTDHLQAVCIWGFALSLIRDLSRAAGLVLYAMDLASRGDAAGALQALQDAVTEPDKP